MSQPYWSQTHEDHPLPQQPPRPDEFDDLTPLSEILDSPPVKRLVDVTLGNGVEVLARPSSFVLRRPDEPDDIVRRIIVLPPHGCTANRRDELNPHPEVRRATITVAGAVRAHKRGFSRLKNLVEFNRFTTSHVPIEDNVPNARPDVRSASFRRDLRSAGETFIAAREEGYGFYHNVLNATSEWVVIVVKKTLKFQRTLDLSAALQTLPPRECEIFRAFMDAVIRLGDGIFRRHDQQQTIDAIVAGCPDVYLPALIEGLNIAETGRHEACTVYALIMKIGRRENATTVAHLARALERGEAPPYYLRELLKKLST